MIGSGSGNPHSRRRTFIVVLSTLFVISVLMMLIARSESETFAKPRAVVDNITAPIVGLINMPLKGAETLSASIKQRSRAVEDNIRLRAELDRLREVDMRAKALAWQINQYEEILKTDIISDIPVEKIPARAVAETNGPFVRSALLSVGQVHGVKKGHAVMTTHGLYGHVVRVGGQSARVLLLSDLNSRIAVMSERSGSRAILTGNNRRDAQLSFVGPEADWKAGDVVLTSGDEGVFPAGLPIGDLQEGGDIRFPVNLFHRKEPIDWVWVYPFTPIAPPEGTEITDEIEEDADTPSSQDTPPKDIAVEANR